MSELAEVSIARRSSAGSRTWVRLRSSPLGVERGGRASSLLRTHISGQWTHNDRTRSGAGPEVESGLVVLEKDTDRTDPSFQNTNHLQTQLDTNRTGYSKILTSETRYFSYSSA